MHACNKVVWRIDRAGFVLAEIDGEDFVWVQGCRGFLRIGGRKGRNAGAEAREDRRVPLRGEAVAVYEGRVLGKVEYAWTRISWLARGCKGERNRM